MATSKQKIAITKTVENGGNVTKAMRDAGYSEKTLNNPSNLTRSKAYKDVLNEAGLTSEVVIHALVQDIQKKPQNRARELALAVELLGLKKADKGENDTPDNKRGMQEIFFDPEYRKAIDIFDNKMIEIIRRQAV